jgi:hypothetical protein
MEVSIYLHKVGITPLMNGSGMGERTSVIYKFSSSPDLQKLLEPFVNKENTFYQSLKVKTSVFSNPHNASSHKTLQMAINTPRSVTYLSYMLHGVFNSHSLIASYSMEQRPS